MQALSIQNLRKVYAGGVTALNDVNLTVSEGDFFGLLGPNGAGKTTIIGIICSLVIKTGGSVRIFDCDIEQEPSRAKTYLGVVPQEFNFNIFETVSQIVLNQAGYYGMNRHRARERCDYYLNTLGLWDKRNEPARNLSGGMKRRLMIARALVHEPRMLILDEPTAGVDIELRRSMWDFLSDLNARGTTIILTTHYLEEAEHLCRNIAIIDEGEIIINTTTRDLIARLDIETFVFDLEAPLTSLPRLPGYEIRQLDESRVEIDIKRGQNINQLFAELNRHKLGVLSMRNKSNRLEELFLHLTA
ncbi:MAG: ABC transporter ATP-binding protein [Leptospiraceae bacterium]|nr:ABC transporter ATP-binding protein [Leptospiraceae bacterium]